MPHDLGCFSILTSNQLFYYKESPSAAELALSKCRSTRTRSNKVFSAKLPEPTTILPVKPSSSMQFIYQWDQNNMKDPTNYGTYNYQIFQLGDF